MTWDQLPVTITAGCTTPAKGRFGHPDRRRTTISVREAAMIQTFPKFYRLMTDKIDVACDIIGNAVPPLFAELLGREVKRALLELHAALARQR
jgi:DNA (cytosine-5)-methyltransferase 1